MRARLAQRLGRWVMPIGLLLAITMTVSLPLPALAQPAIGYVLARELALASDASTPLPDGQWRIASTYEATRGSSRVKTVVLLNESPSSLMPLLVIRYGLDRSAWVNSQCDEAIPPSAFLSDRYGTLGSQLVGKCSRFHTLGAYNDWSRTVQNNDWWKPAINAVGTTLPWTREPMLYAEISVRQWQNRALVMQAFIRAGAANLNPAALKDAAQAGREDKVHRALRDWARLAATRLTEGFIEQSSQARLAALDEPLRGAAGSGTAGGTGVAGNSANIAPQAGKAGASAADSPQRLRDMLDAQFPAPAPADIHEQIREMVESQRPRPGSGATATASPAAPPAPPAAARPPPPPVPPTAAPTAPPTAASTAAPPAPSTAASTDAAPSKVRRLALVIGNDTYQSVSRLQNARADARAMADALKRVGYRVTLRTDLTERSFKDELRQFKSQIQGGDEVLLFFAGHGLQLGGANYLLPTDIRGESEDQVRDDALPLQKVLDDIAERKARFMLAIVDACRDNPFKSTGRAIGSRGLAPTTAATGQMIIFSAGTGQQALDKLAPDDPHPNGVFTRVFLKEMLKPGVPLDRVLRAVRQEVVQLARSIGKDQTPALYDQTVGDFFLRP